LNQIGCVSEENPVWSTNSGDSNLFGLEPNRGCRTANHGQGFPKNPFRPLLYRLSYPATLRALFLYLKSHKIITYRWNKTGYTR